VARGRELCRLPCGGGLAGGLVVVAGCVASRPGRVCSAAADFYAGLLVFWPSGSGAGARGVQVGFRLLPLAKRSASGAHQRGWHRPTRYEFEWILYFLGENPL